MIPNADTRNHKYAVIKTKIKYLKKDIIILRGKNLPIRREISKEHQGRIKFYYEKSYKISYSEC